MKSTFIISLLLISAPCLFAQSISEPDFANRPYLLLDNKLKELEKNDAAVDYKVKGMGYGGMETYYNAFPSKSTTRISGNTFRFVIKVEKGIDPTEMFNLCKAEQKKDRRGFKIGKTSLTGKAGDVSSTFIKFELSKISDGFYKLIISDNLPKGEYAFIPVATDVNKSAYGLNPKVKIYCFAIE